MHEQNYWIQARNNCASYTSLEVKSNKSESPESQRLYTIPGNLKKDSQYYCHSPDKWIGKSSSNMDDRDILSFNEFTIFEKLAYDAWNNVPVNRGKWKGKVPFVHWNEIMFIRFSLWTQCMCRRTRPTLNNFMITGCWEITSVALLETRLTHYWLQQHIIWRNPHVIQANITVQSKKHVGSIRPLKSNIKFWSNGWDWRNKKYWI